MPYFQRISDHFRNRTELELSALWREFNLPPAVSDEDLLQALYIFHEVYGIAVGQLRAADSMRIFLTPPRSSNPVTWIRERKQFDEVVGTLADYVDDSRDERGLDRPESEPTTLREFVAYCTGVERTLSVVGGRVP